MIRHLEISIAGLLIGYGLLFSGCEKEERIRIINGPFAEVLPEKPADVRITWETDIPGNSVVKYGLTSDLDSTYYDEEERQFHSVILSKLSGKMTYYYRVTSMSSIIGKKVKSELNEFTTGENEESLSRTGWEWFAQGQLDSAVYYFNESLFRNDEYAWAYIGLGWVNLKRDELLEGLSNFNTGLTFDPTQLDGRVGRAAISLTMSHYNNVIEDGTYTISANSVYVFNYDSTIDFRDVHIMLAQAYYAIEDFESAQAECDILSPDNGLDPAMPSTWIVNGVNYETYLLALLNLINYLDTLY